jgi:hypothetical protein
VIAAAHSSRTHCPLCCNACMHTFSVRNRHDILQTYQSLVKDALQDTFIEHHSCHSVWLLTLLADKSV